MGIDGVGMFTLGMAGIAGIDGMPIGLESVGSLGILTGVLALMDSNFSLIFGISGQTKKDKIHCQKLISFDRMV